MSNQCIRLFVTGRVQGVFFRQSLKAKSIQNNIFGWVKNLEDGRVECILEGTEENISVLVKWAHSCLLYTSPSPRDRQKSRMPSSA